MPVSDSDPCAARVHHTKHDAAARGRPHRGRDPSCRTWGCARSLRRWPEADGVLHVTTAGENAGSMDRDVRASTPALPASPSGSCRFRARRSPAPSLLLFAIGDKRMRLTREVEGLFAIGTPVVLCVVCR
ncbi:hypothetical protein E2562_038809 [Oryza meyeriana var. granulata]|uniref:Uncharacterized protein n=1 Tax=Oryza meyeriana var. granulata TaxID=110450 RepID=A0A6G1FH20_9ORYZ|nr:hypothetical protein E2562_038809 [Oryza meyeriana var. granulata]